jgi:hypothetical protein
MTRTAGGLGRAIAIGLAALLAALCTPAIDARIFDDNQPTEPALSSQTIEVIDALASSFEPYQRRHSEFLAARSIPVPDEFVDRPEIWERTPIRHKLKTYAAAAEAAAPGGAGQFLAWKVDALRKEFPPGANLDHTLRALGLDQADHDAIAAFTARMNEGTAFLFSAAPQATLSHLTREQQATIGALELLQYGARGKPAEIVAKGLRLPTEQAERLIEEASAGLGAAVATAFLALPDSERDAAVQRLGSMMCDYIYQRRSANDFHDPRVRSLIQEFGTEHQQAAIRDEALWMHDDSGPDSMSGGTDPLAPTPPRDPVGPRMTGQEARSRVLEDLRVVRTLRDQATTPETAAFTQLSSDLQLALRDPLVGPSVGLTITRLLAEGTLNHATDRLPIQRRYPPLPSELPEAASSAHQIVYALLGHGASRPDFSVRDLQSQAALRSLPSVPASIELSAADIARQWRGRHDEYRDRWEDRRLPDPGVSAAERRRTETAAALAIEHQRRVEQARQRAMRDAAAVLAIQHQQQLEATRQARMRSAMGYRDVAPPSAQAASRTPWARAYDGNPPGTSAQYRASAASSVREQRLLGLAGGVALGADPLPTREGQASARIDIRAVEYGYDRAAGTLTMQLVAGDAVRHELGIFPAALVLDAIRFAASEERLLYTMMSTDVGWLHLAHPSVESTPTEYRFSALDVWADGATGGDPRRAAFQRQTLDLHRLYVYMVYIRTAHQFEAQAASAALHGQTDGSHQLGERSRRSFPQTATRQLQRTAESARATANQYLPAADRGFSALLEQVRRGLEPSVLTRNLAWYDAETVYHIYTHATQWDPRARGHVMLGSPLHDLDFHLRQKPVRKTSLPFPPELRETELSMVYEPDYPLAVESFLPAARESLLRFATRIPFESEPPNDQADDHWQLMLLAQFGPIFDTQGGWELDLTADVHQWMSQQTRERPAVRQVYDDCLDFVLLQRIFRAGFSDRFYEDFDPGTIAALAHELREVGERNILSARVVWSQELPRELPPEVREELREKLGESFDLTAAARRLGWEFVPSSIPEHLLYRP